MSCLENISALSYLVITSQVRIVWSKYVKIHICHHAGRSIKCTTSATTNVQSEDVIINIVVNRGDSEPVMAKPQFEFAYMNPVVTAVFPRFGPINGGTMVSIKGFSLNIGGDDSTIITLAGQNCVIR